MQQNKMAASKEDKECLSLRAVRPVLQRVAVYETRTKTYIVGSTNDGLSCRMLKVDRTQTSNLVIEEDEKEYQQNEVQETLTMLESANQNFTTRYKGGLQQVASAFGIVGFIRFLEGYYIILITKRKPVANIGGHILYKVEDTVMHSLSAPSGKPLHPDESKYVKIFQNVDLSSNFYFSYSYDVTHSLQSQMRTSAGPPLPSCQRFIWNEYLLQNLEGFVHSRWILHIICGFISQINISVYGRPIYLTLIARRSKNFAGTRYLKRGINDDGDVANEVEIEQIVHDASTTLHSNGRYTSHVQLRGSVPSYWSQDITTIRPKPQIRIDRATPFFIPAGIHFAHCLKRFGSPVICLNLVKSKEKRRHECLLTDELESAANYLNQFLPPEHHVQYKYLDMARLHRKQDNLIARLEKLAEEFVQKNGVFHSGQELYCHKLNPHPNYLNLKGYGYKDGYIGRDQTGIVRVNCVDCLDRTNTAQFIMGKCALGYQLYLLGVLDEPHLPFDCDTMRLFEEAYEDLGDSQAIQYGGSTLVHRIQTYRKVAPMRSHGRDIYTSTLRYYRNAFTDTDKQMAINIFLGVFVPNEGELNIWELPTDYYLHHRTAREPQSTRAFKSPTKWWKEELITCLPLPQFEVIADDLGGEEEEEEDMEEEDMEEETVPVRYTPELVERDSFDEVYKTYELTDFDRLLSTSVIRTGDNISSLDNDASIHGNPFLVRDKMKKKVGSTSSKMAAKREFSVGIPQTETEPDEYSSDSDIEDDNGDQSSPKQLDFRPQNQTSSFTSYCTPAGLPDTISYYGFDLKTPSKEDMETYNRFDRLYQLSCIPLQPEPNEDLALTAQKVQKERLLWKPTCNYGSDSIFQITPPTVSDEDKLVYDTHCKIAQFGPRPPSDYDKLLYAQFDA